MSMSSRVISSVGQSTCLTSRGSQVRVLYCPPFAGIAQLVEQLTCNQQVVGSSPISGTTFMEGQRSGQTRQTVNLFLRVLWFKSISLHHFRLPRSQAVRHHTLTVACASSNLAEAAIIYVPLAQQVEHLTFNQRVTDSSSVRDTMLYVRNQYDFFYFKKI